LIVPSLSLDALVEFIHARLLGQTPRWDRLPRIKRLDLTLLDGMYIPHKGDEPLALLHVRQGVKAVLQGGTAIVSWLPRQRALTLLQTVYTSL